MAGNFNLGEAVLGTSVDLDGLNRGLDQAEQQSGSAVQRMVTGFGDNMQIIGGLAIAGGLAIGGALAAGAVQATQAFASFEQGMNEVFTLLPGMSADAMGDMTDDVKAFAVEMGVLPESVIPALYQALSAGVPPDNVFDFLRTAQQAAIGGASELTVAVDGISSVVNAYGADTLSATQASDLMFTAVRMGKTTFDELAASLFNVTPTAAALGVNFADVTAALAAMTAQGVPTSVATTQLRQLFVELSKTGSETAVVFEGVAGKSFAEFIAAGGNTQDALILLETAAAEAGVPISDLFGSVEAGNAALQLTGGGTETFTRNLEEMAASTGATEAAYLQMDQGLARTWQRIQATFATGMLEVGNALAPFVAEIGGFIEQVLPQAIAFFEGQVVPVLESIDLSALMGQLMGLFSMIGGFIEGSGIEFSDVLIALGTAVATVVIPAIGGLISTFAPVIATFAAVMAVVALLRSAWENDFLGIRTAIEDAWNNSLKPALLFIWEWLSVHLPPVIDRFRKMWDEELKPALDRLGILLRDELGPLFKAMPIDLSNIEFWLQLLVDILDTTIIFLGGLATAIEWAIDKWRDFKQLLHDVGFALGSLKLPDWLTPGSPTPFELGLQGINEQMDILAEDRLPALTGGIDLNPMMGGALTGQQASGDEYHLHLQTNGDGQDLIRDFDMLKSWANG